METDTTTPLEPGLDFLNEPAAPSSDETSVVDSIGKQFEEAFREAREEETPKEEAAPEPKEESSKEEPEASLEGAEEQEWWRDTKAGEAFKRVKSEAKTAREEAEKLREQLAQYEKVDPKELETLREKLTEQDRKLAAVRLEESDVYREQIREPIQKLVAEAEALGGEELVDALAEPDRKNRNAKISAFMDTVDSLTARSIERLANSLEELMEKQIAIRRDSKAAVEELTAEERRREAAKQEQARKLQGIEADKVFQALRSKLPEDLVNGDIGKKALEATRQTDITKASLTSQVFATAAVNLLPHMAKALRDREAKIKDLEDQVARLGNSSPGMSRSTGEKAGKPGEDGRGYVDSVNDAFARAGWR